MLTRLLSVQAAHRVIEASVVIAQRDGVGHGRWRLALGGGDSRAIFQDDLTKYRARTIGNKLNPLVELFREMRFEAAVMECLRKQLADNTVLRQSASGSSAQVLLEVNNELERQIGKLEREIPSPNEVQPDRLIDARRASVVDYSKLSRAAGW